MDASQDTSYIAHNLLGRLDGVKQKNGYWMARCPAHDDRNPSLSVKEYPDGIWPTCHAGCTTDAILDAAGLTRADLRPSATLTPNGTKPKSQPIKSNAKQPENYYYHDQTGRDLFRVRRYYARGKKKFIQETPPTDGGEKWQVGLNGVEPVLYRLPEIRRRGDNPLFVVEGEKDADRLASMGLFATTSPMGAGKWYARYAAQLGAGPVYILPDNDSPGRAHAEKIVETRPDAVVVELPELDHKEDVSDWLDAGGTPERLLEMAGEASSTPPGYEGRVLLGRAIVEGIEPPRELVDGVLLEGRAHSIYSGPGLGKTFLMLFLALAVMMRGLPVLLYDAENGPRLMAERLRQLGANPDLLDKLLIYLPFPSLATTEAGRLAYEALLDRARPALVCFDSWIGFLAANGLDENSSNDIATFAAHYLSPARSRDIATLMLDHVGHESKHARGSTRKKDELDVVWSLRSVKPFDRESVGQVELQREKDREGWLPFRAGFAVGGGDDGGFVFERSEAALKPSDDGLKDSERKTLQALETYCKSGAKASDWRKAAGKLEVKERSFWNAVRSLKEKGHVLQQKDVYFPATAIDCKPTAMQQGAVDPNATALHCTSLRDAQACSTGADEEGETHERQV